MAGEPAHSGRGRDQDSAVRAALASVRRTTHWHDSTGVPGPHPLLDGRRSGDETLRVPALLQWISRPCGAGGESAGIEPGRGRRPLEYPFVSLATALSWALLHADGGVSVCATPAAVTCEVGTCRSIEPARVLAS